MKCRGCGKPLREGAEFCGSCGHLVGAPLETVSSAQVPDEPIEAKDPAAPDERPVVEPSRPVATATAPAAPENSSSGAPATKLVIVVVVAAVIGGGIAAMASKRSEPTSAPATPETSSTSPEPPARVEGDAKPAISRLVADPPLESGGAWTSLVHWEVAKARTVDLKGEGFQFDDLPPSGSREITLGAESTTVTLTAYGAFGETASSTVSCPARPSSETASTPAPSEEAKPEIKKFTVAKRVDTPTGSAVRLEYETSNAPSVSLEALDQKANVPASGKAEIFVTRKIGFKLRAVRGITEATAEVEVAPDPAVAIDPESQSEATNLEFEESDIVSGAANLRDFSSLSASGDPLDVLLRDAFEGATASELNLFRNAIWARHGLIFKRRDLRAYFAKRPWYRPDTAENKVVQNRVTARENANVQWLLAREEAKKGKGRG